MGKSSHALDAKKFDHALVSIAAPSPKLLDDMKDAIAALDSFQIPYDISIVAAHRAPKKTLRFAAELESKGIEVVIACGAGSAHLPGMIASLTNIPVIGVPLRGAELDGMDSLLSMVQMPPGVPVGAMGVNSAYNAGVFACQILSLKYPQLREKLNEHKRLMEEKVESEDAKQKRMLLSGSR